MLRVAILAAVLALPAAYATGCSLDTDFNVDFSKPIPVWDISGYTSNAQAVVSRLSAIANGRGGSAGAFKATVSLSGSPSVSEQEAAADILFPANANVVVIPQPDASTFSLQSSWYAIAEAGREWVKNGRRIVVLGGQGGAMMDLESLLQEFDGSETTTPSFGSIPVSDPLILSTPFTLSSDAQNSAFCDSSVTPASVTRSNNLVAPMSGDILGYAMSLGQPSGVTPIYTAEDNGVVYTLAFLYRQKTQTGRLIWYAHNGGSGPDAAVDGVLTMSVFGDSTGNGQCGQHVSGLFAIPPSAMYGGEFMVVKECGPGSPFLNTLSTSECDAERVMIPPDETDINRQRPYYRIPSSIVPPAVTDMSMSGLGLVLDSEC